MSDFQFGVLLGLTAILPFAVIGMIVWPPYGLGVFLADFFSLTLYGGLVMRR